MNDKSEKEIKAEEEEVVEKILRNKHILLAKFKTGLTNRDKRKAWDDVVYVG